MGNIGRRHLQAVSRLRCFEKILCCDINQNALDGAVAFCRKNTLPLAQLELTKDLNSVLKGITRETIVIVATTALGRNKLLTKILKRKPYAILAEKPLCQNKREYQEVMRLSKANRVPIYVNFSRHMYDFYQDIYKVLQKTKEKSLTAFFSGGIACNGIHLLELATWLLRAKTYRIVSSKKAKVYETKRKGFHDFSGEMAVKFDGGNGCFLKAAHKQRPFSIEISSPGHEFKIYETDQKMVHVNGTGKAATDNIRVPFVSQLTDKAINRLINRKIPDLPDIHQSFLAHQILFDYMKRHKLKHINIT